MCRALGVELMGVTEVVDAEGTLAPWFTPHAERFQDWLARGAHADMTWMNQQRDARVDPRVLVSGVRSGVTLWLSHHFSDDLIGPSQGYEARVARYAWGRDYHNVLRRVLRQLIKWIKSQDERAVCHGSVDTSPVLERAIAEQCGVGWIGRSTMLIHPQRGTFGSLAVLLTSATFTQQDRPPPPRCGTCTACLDVCPTGALSDQGLDARLCISYWTIEHRGVIPREMRASIGDWVFGCDLCQDLCPWSIKATHRQAPALESLWQPKAERARPDLMGWLSLTDDELNQSLLGSPLRRAYPFGLKRNAMIVLTNQKYIHALPKIWEQLIHESAAVRATAVWSITELTLHLYRQNRLSQRDLIDTRDRLEGMLTSEVDDEVRAELMWASEQLSPQSPPPLKSAQGSLDHELEEDV